MSMGISGLGNLASIVGVFVVSVTSVDVLNEVKFAPLVSILLVDGVNTFLASFDSELGVLIRDETGDPIKSLASASFFIFIFSINSEASELDENLLFRRGWELTVVRVVEVASKDSSFSREFFDEYIRLGGVRLLRLLLAAS